MVNSDSLYSIPESCSDGEESSDSLTSVAGVFMGSIDVNDGSTHDNGARDDDTRKEGAGNGFADFASIVSSSGLPSWRQQPSDPLKRRVTPREIDEEAMKLNQFSREVLVLVVLVAARLSRSD